MVGNFSISIVPMPVYSEQSYTKTKQNITRVNWKELEEYLNLYKDPSTLVLIERPMVNFTRFKASGSALRCLEAVLITVERLEFPRMYCDSKDWQKDMLPRGCKKEELKTASLDIGKRLFPSIDWKGFKDADSLLMAEWARRKGL